MPTAPRTRPPSRMMLAPVVLLALLLAACGGSDDESGESLLQAAGTGGHPAAPELRGLGQWWNSEPFTLAEQQAAGQVVLIDFWTYTCVNCIRTLPYLRAWHETYAEHGLTVLGLHAPEFDFEHDPDNVTGAIERRDIAYPVAQDNNFETWRAYENRFWPAKYLIGGDGTVRYVHFGEGDYLETEQAIRLALERAGRDLADVPLVGIPEPERDAAAQTQTRELYGGYRRNFVSSGQYAGQDEYYIGADRLGMYEDDGERVSGRWYAQGWWRNTLEAFEHARETTDLGDYIAVPFMARTVNVVLTGAPDPGSPPLEVFVELDGRPLRPTEAGADIVFDEAGRSLLRVTEARLYALVDLPAFAERELRLRSDSEDFAIFAFTFGSYTPDSSAPNSSAQATPAQTAPAATTAPADGA